MNFNNVKVDQIEEQNIIGSYNFSTPMVYTLVSPIQILKDNLYQSKSFKLNSNDLFSSKTNFDNNLSESENQNHDKYSKIVSENDLLNLENNFYYRDLSESSTSNINKSKYSLQNFENHYEDNVNGDVDFNHGNISNNSDNVNNLINKSATFQSKNNYSSIKLNQESYSTKQFRDPYFQRVKLKNKSSSSYIYERRGATTKNILNQIDTLESNLQINGRYLEFVEVKS